MHTLIQDLRYGIRMLAKNRGFTFVAALALALGIGANTAIFSVVNAVLLRPLPYAEPDRLVQAYEKRLKLGRTRNVVSAPDFIDWREQNNVFEKMAAYTNWSASLSSGDEPEQITGAVVSADLFPLLRVEPLAGRAFAHEEDQPGAYPVVLISHGLWQRRFGADQRLVGQSIKLDGDDFTVVGIMPAEFQFPNRQTELWAPLALNVKDPGNRGSHYLSVIARLKDGIALRQAQAAMEAIAAGLEQQYPVNIGHSVNLFPLHEEIVGETRSTLLLLFGSVGFVLLIACANVANLLLVRGASRQKELAIRTALGAGRRRIVRQLLTESILLAALGGVLGFFLAFWIVDVLVGISPSDTPRLNEISIDRWVLGFTLLISLLTGILFGLLPSFQVSKPNLQDTLKEGGRSSANHARSGVRSLLVAAEVAAALVLLVGAGLLMKSFVRLSAVKPGFDAANVLTMQLSLPPTKYRESQQLIAFQQQILERIKTLPGVQAAATVVTLPLSGNSASRYFQIEGRPPRPAGEGLNTGFNLASPEYFRALGIPLRSGRAFTERDSQGAPEVVIINEAMARRFWPDEDPLGARLRIGENPWRTIVGVVGDVKSSGLNAEPGPEMFYPMLQTPVPFMTLVVRTASEAANLVSAIKQEVRAVDSSQPVYDVKTMEQLIAESISTPRLTMLLIGIFAMVAMALAAIGLYGVMAYAVKQRTHEIGVRIALGAHPRDVLRLVIRQGMSLVLMGIGVGLVAAFALMRVMSNLLYEVSATDPLTFAVIPLLLMAVALVACYLPARRATKVDPLVALKYE